MPEDESGNIPDVAVCQLVGRICDYRLPSAVAEKASFGPRRTACEVG
ncbi:MAG: hypothetical protein ACUVTG_11605 [Candidatus Oleimicrobiaceae bacterium]